MITEEQQQILEMRREMYNQENKARAFWGYVFIAAVIIAVIIVSL